MAKLGEAFGEAWRSFWRSLAKLGEAFGESSASFTGNAPSSRMLLPKPTPSCETGAFRKLSTPHSASHGPCQTPNDVYDALRPAEGYFRPKWRSRRHCRGDGRSSESVRIRAGRVYMPEPQRSTRLKRTNTSRTHRQHDAAQTGGLSWRPLRPALAKHVKSMRVNMPATGARGQSCLRRPSRALPPPSKPSASRRS